MRACGGMGRAFAVRGVGGERVIASESGLVDGAQIDEKV